ncbi:helix-hairpin-helix domain-containing protein [Arcticibacter sp.]|uniref:helix-hairpin-helix domain-containing protein n=1 Tax=Arcticibacter sp. TaxID=1872630 RepID=UPI00388D1E1C
MTSEVRAQTESDPLIENLLETIAENQQQDNDYAELSERLYFLKEHPYDLNTVNAEQLSELVFLDPLQADNLIKYRRENGPFTDIQELQLIDLFTWPLIEQLLPFVFIDKPALLQKQAMSQVSRLDWMTTYGRVLESQKGYEAGDSVRRYEGSSYRLVSRLRYHSGSRISAGLTMEKDPGERFSFRNGVNGFDFYSANFFVRGRRMVRKLAIGDYSLQFGQGVALWSGLGFGKGASISGIAKVQSGLKPYSSTNESGFFRGVAATIGLHHLELTPFVSFNRIDAALVPADSLQSTAISSISASGLHRTASELSRKGSESQLVYGSVLQYEDKGLRIGALFYQTRFSEPLQRSETLYRRFDFAASNLTNGSLYYNFTWKNTYSFAELSHSFGTGLAMIGGLMGSLSKQVSAIVLYRNYHQDYYSFFSQSIAEGSGVSNEQGLYSGLHIRLNARMEWSLYTDLFKFPWMRYRVDAPSLGREILTQAVWSPNKETKLALRFRSIIKQQNDNVENAVNYLVSVEKENYRIDLSYKIGRSWTLRNRAEMVRFEKDAERQSGTMIYQDIIFKPLGARFSGNCRMALFSTDGFDSRLYAFENDVLYSYAIPAYQDGGIRYYLNGRYRIGRAIDLWLRYAMTVYNDKDEIGSGPDLISGRSKSDIKFQIRYLIK